ncbi:polyprenyl synthetase family protein [Wolbachia endosymbiont of Chironomus riparius]|uniref:polyprenyl synthetase family protein n=1 Tax=Wolbachia endosymbiont of Chironomus riparius TaxID=2883238 RepID=UPI00209CAA75|nr:polyprenyl synthetase family protein [Wolbachia endosymbiont of Chironomus riparius]
MSINVELDSLVSSDLLIMKEFIHKNINVDILPANDIISHFMQSGGKRIRPKLIFIICKMLGYSGQDRVNIAAAVEFIHNATLLHDDVLDESNARHGIETINKIWGNKLSILVGDLLLTIAFRWLIECGNLNVLSILSEASNYLVNGEIRQMNAYFNPKEMKQNYFCIIQQKTASLFSACCEAASVVSGATKNEIEKLKNFGLNFGIAFQIVDDVLDYISNESTSGKQIGKDFLDGKITLPAIIAYDQGNAEEKEFWQRSFSSTKRDFNQALYYINKSNAIQLSIEQAKYYVNIAKSSISTFTDSIYKIVLTNFLNASIEREM